MIIVNTNHLPLIEYLPISHFPHDGHLVKYLFSIYFLQLGQRYFLLLSPNSLRSILSFNDCWTLMGSPHLLHFIVSPSKSFQIVSLPHVLHFTFSILPSPAFNNGYVNYKIIRTPCYHQVNTAASF